MVRVIQGMSLDKLEVPAKFQTCARFVYQSL
jgi:hypothetical protein